MNYFLSVYKRYAEFSGRSRRSEYWYFLLFYTVMVLANMSVGLVFVAMKHPLLSLPFSLLNVVIDLGSFVPSLAVAVRRCHDTGRSGWVLLVPIYGLVVLCTAGVEGPNEYGPDPKGGAPMPAGSEMVKAA